MPEMQQTPQEPEGVKETGLVQMMTGPTFQAMMRQALPSIGLTAERMTRIIATQFRGDPLMQQCTPASFYRSVITCAETGLIPGKAFGYCWILPFKNSRQRTYEATWILGYPGAAELSYRSGLIEKITARTVYEGDQFEIEYGTNERLHHVPVRSAERGEIRGYYSTMRLKGSDQSLFHYMDLGEILHHRDTYVRSRSGPWHNAPGTNEFDWMAKKTVFMQCAKLGPKSDGVQQATLADIQGQQGLPPEIDITDEANLLTQMMEEGAEVNESGGFGAPATVDVPVDVEPGEPDTSVEAPQNETLGGKPEPVQGPDGSSFVMSNPPPQSSAPVNEGVGLENHESTTHPPAKPGEARCKSPIAEGCVRREHHDGACMNQKGRTETFE